MRKIISFAILSMTLCMGVYSQQKDNYIKVERDYEGIAHITYHLPGNQTNQTAISIKQIGANTIEAKCGREIHTIRLSQGEITTICRTINESVTLSMLLEGFFIKIPTSVDTFSIERTIWRYGSKEVSVEKQVYKAIGSDITELWYYDTQNNLRKIKDPELYNHTKGASLPISPGPIDYTKPITIHWIEGDGSEHKICHHLVDRFDFMPNVLTERTHGNELSPKEKIRMAESIPHGNGYIRIQEGEGIDRHERMFLLLIRFQDPQNEVPKE